MTVSRLLSPLKVVLPVLLSLVIVACTPIPAQSSPATVSPGTTVAPVTSVPVDTVIAVLSVIAIIGGSIFAAWKVGGRGKVQSDLQALITAAQATAAQLVFAAETWALKYATQDADASGRPDGAEKMEWLLTEGYEALPLRVRDEIERVAVAFGVSPHALLRSFAQDAFDHAVDVLDDLISRGPPPATSQ